MSPVTAQAKQDRAKPPVLPRRSRRLYPERVAGDDRPGYRLIASRLAARIATGQYPMQSHLPGKRKLADEFGVSVTTVERALRVLADDGLVQASRGSGTQVVNARPTRPLTDRERIDALEARLEAVERRLGEQ